MNFQETIRAAAAEGAVLLKNNDTLPLLPDDKVSVFGRCQIDFYKSGTGSGGSVHVPYSVNLIQGFNKLKDEGYSVPELNTDLIKTYTQWIKDNPFDDGGGVWAGEPWCQKDMVLTPELVKNASLKSNKALYVIGRTAGEDKDNSNEEGSYLLTKEELKNIEVICSYFNKVTIILNVSNIIDLSWIEDKRFNNHITAVLFVWQGGMEGGSGAADVLCGKVCPSGKLTDSIAYSYNDYPCSQNFGSSGDEIYAEDIYVGYRYFSTFAPHKVQFPFGFGLSYTHFDVTPIEYNFPLSNILTENFTVEVKVKNTGNISGKETIQLYMQCPQGRLGKSKRSLVAFKKTPLLKSGETCTFYLTFNVNDFSSYDDTFDGEYPFSYILEKGTYSLFLGTSVNDCTKLKDKLNTEFVIDKTILVKKLEQNCAPEKSFNILRAGKEKEDGLFTQEYIPSGFNKKNLEKEIKENLPQTLKLKSGSKITFDYVTEDNSLIDDFVASLSEKELKTLVRGEGMMSRKVTAGIASAFGGLSESLHSKNIPACGCSDGPSGIRLDNGNEASLVPIGTLLACTWNPELVETLYEFLGAELVKNKIDVLLGPGCNIHRCPLNGRNFEYFSEDPLISGIFAGSVIKGLSNAGAKGTLKHFALNNQEAHRRTENSVASERAIREIYLKPFEIAVKKYNALSIMTSYNGINGHWSSSNYELITNILRKEWNYNGFVMTDWWAAMNDCVAGGMATAKNISKMVRAGADVYMVVVNDTAELNGFGDDLDKALKEGSLTIGELQLCAKHILLFISKTLCANAPLRPLKQDYKLSSDISLPDGKELSPLNSKIIINDNSCELYFEITEKQNINISGTFYKDGGNTLSQSITNINVNGTNCGSFECRSTDGKNANATACFLELEKGIYRIELKHTKPGITVKDLCINQEAVSPVTAGVYN